MAAQRAKVKRRFADLDPATQAGIMCNDPQFQAFAAAMSGLPGKTFTATGAAEYLRRQLRIASRRTLKTCPDAREAFERLKTDFDAWRGRIAQATENRLIYGDGNHPPGFIGREQDTRN